MSTTSGSGAKRAGTPLADAEASPKRARSSRHPSLSPSYSPLESRSLAPSPSQSRSRSPAYVARTPPPAPLRECSDGGAYDKSPSRSRSRSRSHLSEETDGHDWRPHPYREIGGEYFVCISDYDRLFTCRGCNRMLTSPVYQCSSGHVTCSTCRGNTGADVCSYCSVTGCTHNLAVEEFLFRISFSCRNQQYGCDAFLLHHQMRAHDRSCHHEPCFFPVPRCEWGFAGQAYQLESHLANLHRWVVVKFRYGESFEAPVHKPAIFRCEDDDELFHIVSSREGCGTALSMICIRPDNACKEEFTYELKMSAGGRHRLQSTVWNTSLRYGIGEGSDVFLLVPDKLLGNGSSSVVEVSINKAAAGATSN